MTVNFRCLSAMAMSCIVFSASIQAQEAAKPGTAERNAEDKSNPLANLPSTEGSHIAKIRALGDNSWLNLGMPGPDPAWGRAYGRGYYAKMAYAPDLGGAFFYGEGEHGYWNKKTMRYGDDLWFYDLLANRWILCHPGTHVTDTVMQLDEHGFEVTAGGEPWPIAPLVHGYELSTYVPHLKRFMFLPAPGGYWPNNPHLGKRRKEWLHSKGPVSHRQVSAMRRHPFFFNATTGKWEREFVQGRGPYSYVSQALIHMPDSMKTLYYNRKQVLWVYDHAQKSWTELKPSGTPPPGRDYEGVSCYDPSRSQAYFFNRGESVLPYVIDVANNRWIEPKTSKQPKGLVPTTQAATATFDLTNRVAIYAQHRLGGDSKRDNSRCALYAYDPENHSWSDPIRFPDEFLKNYARVNAYYDSKLNVHVFHRGFSDASTKGEIFVYRFRRASK